MPPGRGSPSCWMDSNVLVWKWSRPTLRWLSSPIESRRLSLPEGAADALKQLGQKFAEAEANRKQLIYDIKSALPGADVSVDTREKRVYVVVEGDAPDEVAAFIAHLAANQELSLSISRASHPPGISN